MPPRQALLLEGELKPYGYEHMAYYTAYTVVVEEYRYSGYPQITMTLYPRIVCNRPRATKWPGDDQCPGQYPQRASALEVRYRYGDSCQAGVIEAFDLAGYPDPIRSAVLYDNYGSPCARDQLTADITHADGRREVLSGYRTY